MSEPVWRSTTVYADEALLFVADVAERLNLGEKLTRALVEAGHIPALKVGREYRVPPEALAEFRRRIVVGELRQVTLAGGEVVVLAGRKRGKAA